MPVASGNNYDPELIKWIMEGDPPDKDNPDEFSWGRMASNIYPSAEQYARDLWTAVSNPKQTVQALQNVGSGYAQKLAAGDSPYAVYANEDNVKLADQVTDLYKDRYGGWDNIKRTIQEDPVGALADASGLLTLGTGSAAAAANMTARVANPVGRVGMMAAKTGRGLNTVTRAAANLDPVTLGMKSLYAVPAKKMYKASLLRSGFGNRLSADELITATEAGLRDKVSMTNRGNSARLKWLRRGTPFEGGNERLARNVESAQARQSAIVNEIGDVPVDEIYFPVDDMEHALKHSSAGASQMGRDADIAKIQQIAGQARADHLVDFPSGRVPADEVQKFKSRRASLGQKAYDASYQSPNLELDAEVNAALANGARSALENRVPGAPSELDFTNQRLRELDLLQQAVDPTAAQAGRGSMLSVQLGPKTMAQAGGATQGQAAAVGALAAEMYKRQAELALWVNHLRTGQPGPTIARAVGVNEGRLSQEDQKRQAIIELLRMGGYE